MFSRIVLASLAALTLYGAEGKPTVVVFGHAECQATKRYIGPMPVQTPWARLQSDFPGVIFKYVSTPLYDGEKGTKVHEDFLREYTALRIAPLQTLPTFVVLNAEGKEVYRGLFSEKFERPKEGRQYLREALEVLTAPAGMMDKISGIVGLRATEMPKSTTARGCDLPDWVEGSTVK